jgi:hypothetical protein
MPSPVDHEDYVGIDPGFNGAIAVIDSGGVPQVWDMPTYKPSPRMREYDLGLLNVRFRQLKRIHNPFVGLEWPTTRPGEGAERCKRFGVGLGQLEALLYCLRMEYVRIPPATWKMKLNLDGKTKKGWEKQNAAFFDMFYPDYTEMIRGPRGGIKDGRCDALLIAHYYRLKTRAGMAQVVEQFGKGSTEAMVLCLNGGKKRKGIMRTEKRPV